MNNVLCSFVQAYDCLCEYFWLAKIIEADGISMIWWDQCKTMWKHDAVPNNFRWVKSSYCDFHPVFQVLIWSELIKSLSIGDLAGITGRERSVVIAVYAWLQLRRNDIWEKPGCKASEVFLNLITETCASDLLKDETLLSAWRLSDGRRRICATISIRGPNIVLGLKNFFTWNENVLVDQKS